MRYLTLISGGRVRVDRRARDNRGTQFSVGREHAMEANEVESGPRNEFVALMGGAAHLGVQAKALRVDTALRRGRRLLAGDGSQAQHLLSKGNSKGNRVRPCIKAFVSRTV